MTYEETRDLLKKINVAYTEGLSVGGKLFAADIGSGSDTVTIGQYLYLEHDEKQVRSEIVKAVQEYLTSHLRLTEE